MAHAFPPSRILVACDFSTLSRDALAYAAELAGAVDGELLLVHVADPIDPALPPGTTPTPERKRELVADRNEFVRERIAKDMAAYGAGCSKWSDVVADGAPGETLPRIAVERNCDLIVIGSHGREGLKRFLLGSVAEEVMRHAHCPVLVSR